MRRITEFLILPAFILALSGCGDCLKEKTDNLRTLLNRELKVGDTREKIEKAFNNAGIELNYDKYRPGYESNIYDNRCGPYMAISIEVTLDTDGRLSTMKVFESYTMP